MAENALYSDDAEITRKLQTLRVTLLAMSEIVQQAELTSDYSTFKLYVYEVVGMDRFTSEEPGSTDVIDEFNQTEFVTQAKLSALRARRHHISEVAQQAWALVQYLMNTLAELSVSQPCASILTLLVYPRAFRSSWLKSSPRTPGLWVSRSTLTAPLCTTCTRRILSPTRQERGGGGWCAVCTVVVFVHSNEELS